MYLIPSETSLRLHAFNMPILEIVIEENVCSSSFLLFQKVPFRNSWESIPEFAGVVGVDGELPHGN